MQEYKKILDLTKPYWPRVLGGIVLGLMVTGITGAIAWLVKPALDKVLLDRQYEYLKYLPPGVVLLFAAKGLLSFCQTYLMKSAGMKLMRDTRNKLYKHILKLPVVYFNKETSGNVISRVLNDVQVLDGLLSQVIKTYVMEAPTVIVLLGIAFYRKWDLTLIALVLVPLIALSTRKFGKRVKKKRKSAQRKISQVTHRVGEAIQGLRIIKVFTREEIMGAKFEKENHRFYREMLRVIRLKEFTKLVIDVVTGAGIAAALWYGFILIDRGTLSPGGLGSILAAIYMLFSPIKKIGESYTTFQEIRASIERIDTLLDAKHEDEGSVKIERFSGSLNFNNVSFAYQSSSAFVLRDINLEIKQGEIIAVVGLSGVGKSTLVDLIPKFYKPTEGDITIDGTNLNEVDLQSLRELIGIVSQDIILFNDTVRENIAFGNSEAGDEDIVEAARLAHADEFIQELPDKYESLIGERGLRLSGGQRQRIAIARAILKNPPILILDEATSSLDSVSEAVVQQALEKLMSGRTTIVIAHRLSTIKNADRIIIMERGQISDVGTHEQLMSRSDSYKKLYKAFALT
jgi:subfamily B ATP-binding cassette protein MsbA